MADILRDFMMVGSAVGGTVLTQVAQHDQQIQQNLLQQKKLQAEQYINQKLSDPDYVNNPEKIQQDFNKEFDTSGLSENSIKSLNTFVDTSTFSLQKKQTTKLIKAAKLTSTDDAINSISTIRNSITAGRYDSSTAIKNYEATVAPTLKQSLGSKFDSYDKTVKSSLLLEGLKSTDPEKAAKLLHTDQYVSGLTSDDYHLAQHYIQAQHAETIANTDKAIKMQVQVAKGVMDGTYTPEEIQQLQTQNTGIVSETIGRTAAQFQAVKKMNVEQIDNLLNTAKGLSPPMRALLESRKQSMTSAVTNNLVGWAENNDETKTLNFQDATTLKTSLQARVVDVQHLEQKYGVPAKTIFSPLEQKHLTFSFNQGNEKQKAMILQTMSSVINPTRYKDIDSTLYSGATADMVMIKNNPNSIGILQDSMKGAQMIKNNPSLAMSKNNQAVITQEVSKVYANQPNFVKTTAGQISNILTARGGLKAGDTVSTKDIDAVIEQIAGGSIEDGPANDSSQKTKFISTDPATTALIGDREWTPEVVKTIAQSSPGNFVSVNDFMQKPSGKPYTIDDINKFGQFHTIRPGVYTCTIADPTGNQTVLKDKTGKTIVFNTKLLSKEQRRELLITGARPLNGGFTYLF